MGTHLQLRPWIFVLALLFFMKGSLTLECYSCLDLGDGGCSQEKTKKVVCPASSHVCVETVAAVGWSHGDFSVGEKGCGMGRWGTNDKAVDVHGILAFSQLRQCNSSLCNSKLDIKSLELQPIGNESARVPNGVECYSCTGKECLIDNSAIVKCYDSFQGCFHGNVTMKAGNFSLTRPIKGCVKDEECTKMTRGSPAITLTGSCCSGSLCNVDLSNKTHFSAKIPRLAILPNSTAASTTSTATTAKVPGSGAAPSVAHKPTRSITMSPPKPDYPGHNHDHDHDHDEISSVRDEKLFNAVRVEERKNQQAQLPYGPKGASAGLGGSALLVLMLAGLLL
ncbi:ly6/PLAUR domain-containing protein 3 [Elgaria multicarinata webbii]|uniref:ly6/PLAUR domain-containing protein 3 n=1 Tax=Elgaria multicarinata webbii TaxID=159646 RepID=UPI002FCCF15E